MASTDSWQQTEPTMHTGGLTIFAGSTFLLADQSGEIRHEPQGFFVADRRVLSAMRLLLPGHDVIVLRSGSTDEDRAHVVRRAMRHGATEGEPPLLVSTRSLVSEHELEIEILLRSCGPEPRTVTWELVAEADFADIFAVKEGRIAPGRHPAPAEVQASALRMSTDALVVEVVADHGSVVAGPRGLSETLELPARDTVVRRISVHAHNPVAGHGHMRRRPANVRHPQLATRGHDLASAVAQGIDDVSALRVRDPLTGGDALAAGAPWFMTLFGRDSLITSLMLAAVDHGVGHQVLQSLARRQGVTVDALSEEEPGRILHETRMTSGTSLFEGHRTNYYGSTDSTPLFVVVLAELVRNGLHTAQAADLLPAADGCLAWIDKYGDVDDDGFVESVRRSPSGLINQGWKDSWNAIVDADGRVVEPPVDLVEVQAYVYAAFRARAYLARVLEHRSGATWDSRADHLRTRIDEAFWLPELGTYALALGPDKRPLASSTSNAGHMLWTGAALPERVPRLGVTLMGRELRTHWGLRTLSAAHPAFDPLGYHTGSVWPHDTALVAWGLARWGLTRAAGELSSALVRTAASFGGTLPELISGLEAGDPLAGDMPVRFPTACSPQAWAAAAPMLLLRAVLGLEVDVPGRRVLVDGAVPDAWLPLTMHGVRFADATAVLRASHSGVVLTGLPPDVVVERSPLFL